MVSIDWSHLYTRTHQTKARSTDAQWNDELFNSVLSTVERLGRKVPPVVNDVQIISTHGPTKLKPGLLMHNGMMNSSIVCCLL